MLIYVFENYFYKEAFSKNYRQEVMQEADPLYQFSDIPKFIRNVSQSPSNTIQQTSISYLRGIINNKHLRTRLTEEFGLC